MRRAELKNCFVNISGKDISFVSKALQSDVISGKSFFVGQFEKKLCDYFSVKHAVTCTSGTSAIQMALHVFGVKKGDEVMLPPTAPIMSVLPILSIGAIPIFIDLKSNKNFNLSIEDVCRKISPKTKVVMNVPMWGYPNNSRELHAVCVRKKIYFLEDLSHCHGARLSDGVVMGSIGDISIFSTHERKMITTGEGGFLLTDNERFYDDLIKLRSFGVGNSYEYGVNFGLNYKMSGINAALGITQMEKIGKKIDQRSDNARYLLSHLQLSDKIMEVEYDTGVPNYYALALIFKEDNGRASEISQCLYENSIVSDTYAYHYKPLYNMPILREYKNNCPLAEVMTRSIITLPTHEGLKQDDLEYITKVFNQS